MIVWLASFPRSGNTFTRIVLRHLYDVPTYTVATEADDLSVDKGAGDLTGNRELSELWPDGKKPADKQAFLDELDARDEVFFIKTHSFKRQSNYRTILLARNGMDVYVSLANYFMDVFFTWKRFGMRLARLKTKKLGPWVFRWFFMELAQTLVCSLARNSKLRSKVIEISLQRQMKSGSWKYFHKNWLEEDANNLVTIRFDDLIADPVKQMTEALEKLNVQLPFKGGEIPTFEELKKVHPKFFRKGRSNTWKTEFPEALQKGFWEQYGSTMKQLGFEIPSP